MIWTIAGVIAVCTLSLLYIQFTWIESVRHAEEDGFVQKINTILTNVVTDIEEEEVDEFIRKTVQFYDGQADSSASGHYADELYDALTKQNQHADDWQAKTSLAHEAFVKGIRSRILHANLPIAERLSMSTLHEVLDKEFQKADINLPYEFGVTNQLGEIVLHSDGFQDIDAEYTYAIMFFPKDPEYAVRHFLNVYVPYQASFILKKTRRLIMASIILSLIITITFTANLLIIFRQKRLSEIKNDFVNNITHELKTPITTISLAAQMMSDPNVAGKMQNMPNLTHTIYTESKRLQFLVEKILQIAIFERGNIRLKLEETDLWALLNTVVQYFSLQIERKKIVLETDFDILKNVVVWADETQLVNVFTNLMDNAIKYQCGEHPYIKVKAENVGNEVHISVIDNGCGISRENVQKIFDKFYRVPTGNIHTVKGFGLGLSYAKKIVEMHRGTVKVKSEPGEGSTFKVILPIVRKKNI